MPAQKSDVKIIIEAGGERFSLNCQRGLWGSYSVKVGRTRSAKHPQATLTEIFDIARKWAVARERMC